MKWIFFSVLLVFCFESAAGVLSGLLEKAEAPFKKDDGGGKSPSVSRLLDNFQKFRTKLLLIQLKNPETYHVAIKKDYFDGKALKQLQEIASKYTTAMDALVTSLETTQLKDIKKSIDFSEQLGDLTKKTIDAITAIEKEVDLWEALMSKLDFYLRQEYNVVRYKLDTSVSAFHWDYYGKANYVWSG